VQYNTDNHLLLSSPGPYPFSVGKSRVTDENATVTFTKPEQVLLQTPNKITGEDFGNWIQERGVYFPEKLDEHYETMLSMHDGDEKALENAVIFARYGKGKYVYTGLSFFRELPAGVAGAYRLFANLIGKN
jgi:hypothetical protein